MAAEGATIIDIGGESTRPGAAVVDAKMEQDRILPIIRELAANSDRILSGDTYRASTARLAVEAGAHIINDIWGCQKEPDLAAVAADLSAGLVIMNNRRDREVVEDLIDDAKIFLTRSLHIARDAGNEADQLVLDPGIGFASSTAHDIPLLSGLSRLHELDCPLLLGTSRKRFLGELTGREAKDRGAATAATSVVGRMKGMALFRVHDIPENKDALAIADAVIRCEFSDD